MHYGRELRDLPGLVWGGVFLVILELVVRRQSANSGQ